ncbi:wall-associated receptor kinase 2 [Phtheirospermum japonicum]|uniref:Wall-associated receptor kinase 2 n=1 Tax=Phtheirospermum japonicum TaxID=374723 RepID=A0A830CVK8_9LAMI|nr:wall-associated receptor kinase 2 [Phtheirospermum japonicum]
MISQAIIVLVTIILLWSPETNSAPVLSNCQATCGNLSITFPFGTTSNCSLDHSFLISCDHNYNPPRPFLNSGTLEILDISLDDGLIRIASSVASDCYDNSGSQLNSTISELALSQFTVSSARNKFTAIGCDTYALVEGSSEGWKKMSAGCVSWCDDISSVRNGTCSGIGCCQTSIPSGVKDFLVDIRSFRNHTRVRSLNPCGYAFVVEDEAYEFMSSDLEDLRSRKSVPVVLDWSVGNVSCWEARKNLSGFACVANHSECIDSSNEVGYRCKCMKGFEGNPYLVDGCQDINECDAPEPPCEGECTNSEGSYSCSCPKGFEGDGKKDGSGCHSRTNNASTTLFYIASGFMIPAVGSSWIFWRRKQKKVANLRQNIFIGNGGKLLEDMQSRGAKTLSVFTADDLAQATNNYDENNILHRHSDCGTSYKGMLPDGTNRIVTVRKHDEPIDDRGVEAFIGRIVSLSRIHHRNVAKLIGCCLETPGPLLVYEFITISTLYDYIHDDVRARSLSWDARLRIAADTAGALAHVHTSASAAAVPIIHARLSSSGILLHHGLTVKLCDFALTLPGRASGEGESCYMGVTGYIPYIDPEYLVSGHLTGKSDVYSVGVVLVELLTGKDLISYGGPMRLVEFLVERFVSSVRGDELVRILDDRLETDDDAKIEMLTKVGKLAEKCLSSSSLDRPTMKEVAIALESIVTSGDCSSTAICPSSSRGTTARRVMRRNRSL